MAGPAREANYYGIEQRRRRRNPDGSWGWVGTILFMTESKQGYEQGLRGWESDLMTAVYADVARRWHRSRKCSISRSRS